MSRIGCEGSELCRQLPRRGVVGTGIRAGQGQELAVVDVDVDARSAPITTTTSTPVTPVTGVALETARTWVGLTPMEVAMDAAGCCIPGE